MAGEQKPDIIDMTMTADWICGFTDGEGTFFISIEKKPKMTLGKQVRLGFKITQGENNVQVLYKVKEFFGVGTVKAQRLDSSVWEYRITDFKLISKHIVPFFENNKLHTTKKFDFFRLRHVQIMMLRGEHLTVDGLSKMERIRSKMNLPSQQEQPAMRVGKVLKE